MALTPYMELDLPVSEQTPGPDFASLIVAAFQAIDSHNHTGTGEGRPIPSSGLNIDDDLEFNGHAPTEMRAAIFENQANNPAENLSMFFKGGEFWVKDTSGNAVQITENGQVKFSGSGGGFGGDYGAPGVDALASYSDTTKTFSFTQSAGVAANLAGGKVAVAEPVSGGKAVTVQAPTGMVDNYPMILPPALPAATNLLHMEDDGTMGFAGFTETDFDTVEALATNASKSPYELVNVGLSITVPTAKTFDSPAEVDLTLDQVTIPTHGYAATLQGQLTTTDTLPTGLSLATTYFLIKVDANTVAFATTFANALAGTKIDLTGAGAGVHTFTPTAATLQVELKQADGATDPSTGSSACKIGFRSSTLTSGAVVERSITAPLSIVIPAGATLGVYSSINDKEFFVYAIDNAGTVVLGVSSSSHWADQSYITAPAAIDTSADDSARIYSNETLGGTFPIQLIGSSKQPDGTFSSGWATPAEVLVRSIPRFKEKFVFLTAGTNSKANHNVIYVAPASGTTPSISLPLGFDGFQFTVKRRNGGGAGTDVVITRNGSETIDYVASDYTMSSDLESATFRANTVGNWFRVS